MGTAINSAQYAVATQSQRGVASGADMMGLLFGSGNPAQNHLINGAMDFWQRGTSLSNYAGGAGYIADRWLCGSTGATTTYARSTDVPSVLYSYSLEGTEGSNSYSSFAQRIESDNSRHLVGKKLTLRFWIKTTSPSVRVHLKHAASKDVFSGGTEFDGASIVSQITSGVWSLVTHTFVNAVPDLGANGVELLIYYNYASGAAQSAKITGVQLNVGAVALPFQRAGGTIGGELLLCQRYYERGSQNRLYLGGNLSGIQNAYDTIRFTVKKRIENVSVVVATNFGYYNGGSGVDFTPTFPIISSTHFFYNGNSLVGNWNGWTGTGVWTADAEL